MTYTHKDHLIQFFINSNSTVEEHRTENDIPDPVVRIGYTSPDFPKPTYFDGLISEVRFYQRALDPEQIAALATKEPAGVRSRGALEARPAQR